ncbi:MAG: acetylxylan esterase [Verrucomicrobiota bacterium]
MLFDLEKFVLYPTHPGNQLRDHVFERSRLCFEKGDQARDDLKSSQEVKKRQTEIRSFFLKSLGDLPSFETPLNAQTIGRVEGKRFDLERIIFESRPRHYVTANLYMPHYETKKCGAVLFLCGHHLEGKHHPEYLAACETLVRAGLIVLAIDPPGQGERLGFYDPELQKSLVAGCTTEHEFSGIPCRLFGETIARYFLHDAMRAIDYLLTRPEVDPKKIGVTGNSGGGLQTSLVMLADPRIAAAAPATFIMSRASYLPTGQPQDAEQILPGFTSAGYDHEDFLLAMAPKPVCILAVTSDFFPIEGTRRTVSRSRRIWDLFGKGSSSKLELVEDDATHFYTPALAQAAARFFSKHLLGRKAEGDLTPTESISPKKAWCTKSGQIRGEIKNAQFIYDANLEKLQGAYEARHRFPSEKRLTRAKKWLKEQVFAHRVETPLNPRMLQKKSVMDEFEIDLSFWWTQPSLANVGVLIRSRKEKANSSLPVTVALWDEGSKQLHTHIAWIKSECQQGRAVLVLNLCGMGPLAPHPINFFPDRALFGTFHRFADDLTWIGDSLTALRTYEVTRSFDRLEQWQGVHLRDLRVYAVGRLGVYAHLAAFLDPRVKKSEWKDRFTYAEWVKDRFYDSTDAKSTSLPQALRYFDLDEI